MGIAESSEKAELAGANEHFELLYNATYPSAAATGRLFS
jgi:hypothetical protein